MKVGDIVYLTSTPHNDLPFLEPRRATITEVFGSGTSGLVTVETDLKYPMQYLGRYIYTYDEAKAEIRKMALECRRIADKVLA